MPARQPLPRLWLMTDERLGEGLLAALERLPTGAGIVFRHYSLRRGGAPGAVRAGARGAAPGLLLLAGPADQAAAWGADGSHGAATATGCDSASVHDLARDSRRAKRAGAELLFLSPVFPTRSPSRTRRRLGRRAFRLAGAADARCRSSRWAGWTRARAESGSRARRLWLGGNRRLGCA